MRRLFLAALLVTALVPIGPSAEQQQPPPPASGAPPPVQAPGGVFRSRREVVTVDAIVRDKSGAIVRGLTAEDFEIREDGRDLIGAFRALAPARAPIRIQRWTVRRLAVTVGVLLGAAIAVSLVWANLRAIALR